MWTPCCGGFNQSDKQQNSLELDCIGEEHVYFSFMYTDGKVLGLRPLALAWVCGMVGFGRVK